MSESTPRDMATIMENTARPIRIKRETCDAILDIMYRQMDYCWLPRYIENFEVHGRYEGKAWAAHKTGCSGGSRSDVGFIHTDFAEWVVSVMVDREEHFLTMPDEDGGVLCIQEVSRCVQRFFKAREDGY